MKFFSSICSVFFFFLISNMNLLASEKAFYTLHSGDQLDISVWREETLDKQVTVLPDGRITFPLIGSLLVEGLTSIQVEKMIKAKLEDHVPDAEVTVLIIAVSGNRVFVIGKVARPGGYILESEMNVAQVLSLAGGLDRFADQDKIKILRTTGDTARYFKYDYEDLLSGKSAQDMNFNLKAGDVVIVP